MRHTNRAGSDCLRGRTRLVSEVAIDDREHPRNGGNSLPVSAVNAVRVTHRVMIRIVDS